MQLHIKKLRERCKAKVSDFYKEGEIWECPDGRKFIYKDNGSNILGVAHLDSVSQGNHFSPARIRGEDLIFSEQLDDRLGAYILLDHLPNLGINIDVLLTEGEESGNSTAEYFTPPEGKQYNWVFAFDRAGTDVVMYQFEDPDMEALLTEYGFKMGVGSFSDITSMELGIKMFNFGTGYYDNHARFSHMVIGDTLEMIDKFIVFYKAMKDTKLPHDDSVAPACGWGTGYDNYGYGYTGRYGKDPYDSFFCDECGTLTPEKLYYQTGGLCDGCAKKNYPITYGEKGDEEHWEFVDDGEETECSWCYIEIQGTPYWRFNIPFCSEKHADLDEKFRLRGGVK